MIGEVLHIIISIKNITLDNVLNLKSNFMIFFITNDTWRKNKSHFIMKDVRAYTNIINTTNYNSEM